MAVRKAWLWFLATGLLTLVAFVTLSVWSGYHLDATATGPGFWSNMIWALAPIGMALIGTGHYLNTRLDETRR